ncbi:MAG: C25 family cysteine peptidase [Candidatus Thermoplasmatota archaeon]|nr:C25 family cysteine peptidase [Candidatus Thermoplasmatota archaeon]
MRFAPIAVFAAVMLVAVGFSGCISKPEELKSISITKPESFALASFEGMKGDVSLPENANESVPLFAPVFKNFGYMVSLGWKSDKFKPIELQSEEKSLFSSKLAVAYWGVNAPDAANALSNGSAIVVFDYRTALQTGPLASMLNAPILYYGPTTLEALWRIGATSFENVIVAGADVPESLKGANHLATFDDILAKTIEIAKAKGVDLNYITVVNAGDVEELQSFYSDDKRAPYTPRLSCYGSMFSALRNGVVLTVGQNPAEIDGAVQNASAALKSSGMNPKFLFMLGDSVSLPFVYYWVPGYANDAWITQSPVGIPLYSASLGGVPTDNVYADLEEMNPNYNQTGPEQGISEKILTPELASGRLVAKTLAGLGSYLHRVARYNEYLTGSSAPAAAQPMAGAEWNNNGFAYSSTGAEFGAPEELQGYVLLINDGKFNAQEGSAFGHLQPGVIGGFSQVSGMLIAEQFANSNYIIAGADHGCPYGNSVNYDQLLPMPPNVNFQISCLTGMIDCHNPDEAYTTVSKSDSYTYAMLENGVGCYVASMRSTIGCTPPSVPTQQELSTGTSGQMSYYFFDYLVKGDCTVGEAFRDAKANLYANPNVPTDEYIMRLSNSRVIVMQLEYELYGDPAFNPYEPCNEGSN